MENKMGSRVVALTGSQQTTLDVLRIFAAMIVLLGHSFSYYQMSVFKDQTYFPYIQNMGVVIFFLLSGFLLAYSIEMKNREHQYTFLLFFKHKAIRISKEYIPGLVFIAIIDAISIFVNKEAYIYYDWFNIKQFIGNVFMLQNMGPYAILGRWFIPFGSGRPLWTLSVEWWMYMLFGAIIIFVSNRVRISFPKLIVFGGILLMACEYLLAGRGNGLGFVFALGILCYYSYDLISKSTAIVVFILSCLAYIVYGLWMKDAYTMLSFILLWVIFCCAIKMGAGKGEKSKRNAVLAFISKSTFMLYLLHYSIIDLIYNANMNCSSYLKFFAGIIISLILSFGAYYCFGEKDVIGKLFKKINIKLKK